MQVARTHAEKQTRITGWRIQGLAAARTSGGSAIERYDAPGWARACATAAGLGFDTLSVPAECVGDGGSVLQPCLSACKDAGLRLMLDWVVPGASAEQELSGSVPGGAFDGVAAVLLRGLADIPGARWGPLLHGLRERHGDLMITVWTPGMSPEQLAALEPLPVDGVYSSLPWWNFRDAWLLEEYERLRVIAPVIAPLADPRQPLPSGPIVEDAMRRLAVASVVGEGLMVPEGYLRLVRPEPLVRGIERAGPEGKARNGPRRLTGPLAELTALFRAEAGGRLLLLNPDLQQAGSISRVLIERRLPNGYQLQSSEDEHFALEPGAWAFLPVMYADTIAEHGTTSNQLRRSLSTALRAPRIAIEAVRPSVDGGAFPVKRILGESITIRADIFMDGHEQLGAELLWRAANESTWFVTPMAAQGNDVWEAHITPRRLGRYVYAVRAWLDRWGSFCVHLEKKAAAGQDVSLEVEEGRRMLIGYLELAGDQADGLVIEATLDAIGEPWAGGAATRRRRRRTATAARLEAPVRRDANGIPPATPEQVETLLDDALAAAIARVDEHAFETQTPVLYPLTIERQEAAFSSWYELFPRSQSPVEGRHGTLQDVIARLPFIRSMGFNVLYFPPIHPIGLRNRKGRNNSLQAGPDDPGSPYAIGSAEGGHDAIHPELGTLDDFRELVGAAQLHGMEIALDFAIQCSPDHPWLKQHPDWFNWRVDGSLRYAENPPKRYEDIVTPDFYSPQASSPRQAALWRALRDIVLFWIHQGVRIFRVDNPHTKPLPFWEWMLREVLERYPDTIFLSEAFTRAAMMYRLAKLGFSQSYTYFTWRNTRQELTDYMIELNSAPIRHFFRPNFFVNTPDINPWFLQTSGRAGFLIRAVLASTLSGSWGMYNGFELCVSEPVPGKEEYLDSEKYQLRHWDMAAPGNIIEEITKLNRIRRSHPALQSHLGVRFHRVDNEQIICYTRFSAQQDSVVVVAISLDPHHRQGGTLELPLEQWGMPENAQVPLHDLFEDRRFSLQGRFHYIELTPERPFVLWARVRESGGAI